MEMNPNPKPDEVFALSIPNNEFWLAKPDQIYFYPTKVLQIK